VANRLTWCLTQANGRGLDGSVMHYLSNNNLLGQAEGVFTTKFELRTRGGGGGGHTHPHRNPSMPRIYFHCNWHTIDCCWSESSKRQWQSTDTHPTTQMEVGWGTSLRAGIHTFSVQASHALFDLSGVVGGPKLSLSGCTFWSGICCWYVLNSSTYSFGQMTTTMMTCGCFTDNNYRPQLGSMMTQAENAFGNRGHIRKKNLFFFKKNWIRDGNIYSVGKSCYGKSTQSGKSTQPHLSNVSRSFYVSSVFYDKKIHSKYKGLCERKLTFSELATSEIQVPIWLIDVYWSGIFFFNKIVKFSKSTTRPSKRLSWKGFDGWFLFYFWWFFIST